MTELTREQTEALRVRFAGLAYDGALERTGLSPRRLCALIDLALRTHDAEARAEWAEALLAGVRSGVFDAEEIEHHIGGYLDALAKPSGEQEVGCEDQDGLLHVHPAGDTCEVCYGTEEVCVGENAADTDAWVQCPHCDARTPEQAQDELVREGQERGEYGDALAAVQRMKLRLPVSDECAYQHAMDAALVRRHLTASAVPEQIQALRFWQGFGERAVIILHNMAQENSGLFRIRRWPISDEPLRNDAARLLREYDLGRILPADRQYAGDAAEPQHGGE